MTRLFLFLYDFFRPHRKLLFSLTAGIIVLLALLASRVHFDENITDIFPKTTDGQNMSMVFNNLKSKDKIIVLFSARRADVSQDDLVEACDAFAAGLDTLNIHESIRSVTFEIGNDEIARTTDFIYDYLPVFLDQTDYARIDSLIRTGGIDPVMQQNYQRMLSPAGIGLGEFIARDPLSIGGKALGELQNFNPSLSYKLYDDHIFSSDLTTCLLLIEPTHASNDTSGNDALITALDRLLEECSFEGVEVTYFGTPGIAVYNARQIKSDTYVTLSVALLLIVAVITFSFRNRWSVLLITLPVCFGGLFALGFIALTIGHISLIAIGAGAAVFGIAISYSMHVVCHANHTTEPREIIAELAYPMTVGSLTTIGAFVGLMYTSSSLLSDFGLFAALTLVGTTFFSLVCLPHLLESEKSAKPNRLLLIVERFNAYRFERNKWLVSAIVLFFLLGVFTCRRVGFDNDMSHLSYIPPKITQAEQQLEELFGVNKRSVTIIAAAPNEEQAVQKYTAMCSLLADQVKAGHIESVVSAQRFIVAPSIQQQKIAQWEHFWNTDDRRAKLLQSVETAGRKAGFAEGAFYRFQNMLTAVYAPINYSDGSDIPLLGAWISVSEQATLVLAQIRLDQAQKEPVYQLLTEQTGAIAIDRGYFANKMAQTVSEDFNYVLYMSGLLVFFALLITYRRLELTLMTFAPMFIAFTIILGLMAVLGIEFNIVNIILSTFIFGIGDDFSIFIMDGLQREYSNGRPMLTNHKTAIFFSVLTTIIGIGALAFANHPVLRSTSIISIIGMLAVILSAYTILPLLFRWFVTGPIARGGQPHTLSSLGRAIYGFFSFVVMCILAQIVIPTLIFLPVSGRCRRRWLRVTIHKGCKWLLWMASLTEHKIIRNDSGEDFSSPAIVIANHHSFIDILLLLSLSPRLVMVTNSWVWRSPIFGRIVRYLGFCCVDKGYEHVTDHIRQSIREGNSVVIFPEGTRSKDGRTIGRFHKGAFYLAEQLDMDIVPILIYGTGMLCSKEQPFSIKKGNYGGNILPRIMASDRSFGNGYRERTKSISRHFKAAYEAWCAEQDTVSNPYFRQSIINNYFYKTNRAEVNARRRMRQTRNFGALTSGIARDASTVVFGAGQGELPLLLALLSPRRNVTAFEANEELIQVARHSRLCTPAVTFIHTDYDRIEIPAADYYLFTSLVPRDVAERIAKNCQGEVRYE
ncbi:1-acyl-sn-glycerol-3-phosphate acyltransferase [uncultured Alistipes sp.]|jgi:Predicted exporter|uniref:1-acyl-sn-glycerol-3-phosphate acyltransferase n=1 Tax=uncultured Alistipes sp. TaxID=538949 RepID=UPI0025CB7A1A|nr:1-acyl-sn-glycerol-3-phosphate acyltransferase [uncultured Alistipes sp.]